LCKTDGGKDREGVFSMKKCKILVVGLIVLLLACNYTWADEPNGKVDYLSTKNVVPMSDDLGIGAATDSWVSVYGPGGGLCALGIIGGTLGFFMLDTPWNYVAAGGGLVLIGLGVWLIIDSVNSSNTVASVNNNAVLRHVLFDATADTITLGVRFRR
jgi:multisubunit Na+/H+ antiporter MnhB subunit